MHEIKHDGYRLMARRDALSVGIRLLTKNGHDWASRYPLILQAVRRLKVRSCLIDGEAVCCNERGVSSFDKLRHRSHDPEVFLVAFDLLELDGNDLRSTEISPVADPATRTYTVKVTLKNPPPQLRFGMSIGGRLKGQPTLAVALPLSALFEKNGSPAVWVLDQQSSSLALRPITVARYEANTVVVGSGLGQR